MRCWTGSSTGSEQSPVPQLEQINLHELTGQQAFEFFELLRLNFPTENSLLMRHAGERVSALLAQVRALLEEP